MINYRPLLILPATCLIIFLLQWQVLPQVPEFNPVFPFLPYICFGIGILLSLQFNQSRLALINLLLLLGYSISQLSNASQLLNLTAQFLWVAFASATIAILIWLQDRGLFTSHGAIRLTTIASASFILIVASNLFDVQLNLFFSSSQMSLLESAPIQLPDLILLCCVLCLIAAFVCFYFYQTSVNATIFLALPLFFAAENWQHLSSFQVLAYTSIAIAFVVAVLFDSYNMAYRDELTALPSRRALNQLALGLPKHYTVAMMDVDHFKKFNDTHGHDVGDQVLKMVASRIAKVTGSGKPFRYGGEEFTIVFPRKAVADSTPHLEAVREAIGSYKMALRDADREQSSKKQRNAKSTDNKTVSVTISIGVAERNAELGDFEKVLKAADEALYRAKKAGRNRLSE